MNLQKPSLAIIGGGITGIAAALELAKSDRFEITLFEKADHLGGMSDYYTWDGITWDRFYHVILSTDTVMLDFIRQLGLKDQLFWKEAKSGFYGDGKLVSMSTTLDFIRFPFLSLWDKFRLGLGILYSARIKDPTKLDRIYAKEWLTKVFGRRVYESIWDPLLRSKLGSAREKTSAAFIWATIARLYGARSAENKQEKMGHVQGGYKTILDAAEKKLTQLGVRITLNSPVNELEPIAASSPKPQTPEEFTTNGTNSTDKTNSHNSFSVEVNGTFHRFDNVLFTVNCPAVLNTLHQKDPQPYWEHIGQVKYLGVICVLLFLSRTLSPYYVINLLDKKLPFTGIIEATNIVPPYELKDLHLVYLPKYITENDPLNTRSDTEIKDLFTSGLQKVYPELKEEEILYHAVFRETFVQPLQELNYLKRSNSVHTPIDSLYLVNTSMISNSTLNNNAAITLAKQAAEYIASK